MEVMTGKANQDVLEYLLKRRSAKIEDLSAPGPDESELKQILSAALRVPDHGKMCPWYVLVFKGEARAQVGDIIADAYMRSKPDAKEKKIEAERDRFMRTPLVVALISRARKGKKPIWEQILSGGAAGMNLSLAAHALGYGVQWVSEWYAYDDRVKAAMGMDERDHVIGFFYIGTTQSIQKERDRPDLSKVVTHWAPNIDIQKGDCYDVEKLGFPEIGFDLSAIED